LAPYSNHSFLLKASSYNPCLYCYERTDSAIVDVLSPGLSLALFHFLTNPTGPSSNPLLETESPTIDFKGHAYYATS
ncbi:hypothetical protein CLOP_g23080, partial [Closterium sp. NIES-67]